MTVHHNPAKRGLFFALGILFFSLGSVGVFLPVLPTTPFMLLALWAFSKSSARMHNYVWHHPRFGPTVRAWHEHRVIPMHAKILALVMMSFSASYLIFFASVPLGALIAALALMAIGATYVAMAKSTPTRG